MGREKYGLPGAWGAPVWAPATAADTFLPDVAAAAPGVAAAAVVAVALA